MNAGNFSGLSRVAWVPIPLGIIAILALAIFPVDVVWLPPIALSVLNIVFLSSIMFLVSVFAAMGYLKRKSAAVLLLGCGTLAYGLAALLAGLFYPWLGAAPNVATYNAAVYLAALCFLGSAISGLSVKPVRLQRGWPALLGAYLAVVALISIGVFLVAYRLWPAQFVEGSGATAFGLGVGWVSAALFALSSVLLMIDNARGEPSFRRWYSLGLGLIAVGLIGMSLQKSMGDPLNLLGRSSQYLGCVYLLIASVLSIRQTGEWMLPLERALRETRERLRRISSVSGIGLFEWDHGRNQAYWSPEAYKLFGCEPGSPATYERWIARVHPDDRQRVARLSATILERGCDKSGVAHKHEYRVVHADGTVLWLETTTACDRDGGDLIVRGAVHDITERKRAEEAVQAQRQLFETIVDNQPAGILILRGSDMKIIHVNQAYQSIAPGKVMAGNNIPEVWPEMPGLEDTFREVLATGEPFNAVDAPFIIRRYPDGPHEQAFLSWSLYRIRLPGDDGWGILNTALDTTEHKRAEDALQEAKAQAELYVDLMGHDINNMHQIALGYLEMAREKIKVEEPHEMFIEKPIEVLQRSSRLIQNVRKLQRSRSGGYRPEVVDLGALIDDVSSQYKHVPGRHVNVTADTGRGVVVEANELLGDVFVNLIDNAIKHTTGPAFIDIRMNRVVRDGRDYCAVTVEDNGPGIPDDMKGQIFERLRRGRTNAAGSGLGLYLVKSLVEGYGGRVWVEDRVPGDHKKGAKFVILLPTIKNVVDAQIVLEESVQKA